MSPHPSTSWAQTTQKAPSELHSYIIYIWTWVWGEGDDRGCDGWMASLTRWTWVWASSRRWWRTGKPGMLQSMGVSKSWTDWVTEKQQQSYMWVGGWINNLMLKIACCHDFMSWEEQDKRHKLIIKLMPRELGRKKKRTL